MKRFLQIVLFYLKYTLYCMITMEERRNYSQAEIRGYDCIASRDDSYVIYGATTLYTFDRTKPPTRHYLTFKQYKKLYYVKDSKD